MPHRSLPTRSSKRIAAKNSNSCPPTLNFDTHTTNTGRNESEVHNATTASNTSATSTANQTVISNSGIRPLMSLNLSRDLGPQTTSSPETNNSITTPEYSSLTAREIHREFSRMSRQNPRLPTLPENYDTMNQFNPNEEREHIRNYIDASVGAVQVSIMRSLQEDLAVMIPEAIRNSIDSQRQSSFEHSHQSGHMRTGQNDTNPQVHTNHTQQQGQQAHTNQQSSRNRRFEPHYQQPPQQYHSDFYHGPQTQYVNQNLALGYKPITPLQLQKWGLKYDGSSKSVSVEEFVFRAESLRLDYNCPWDVFVKGFHHLLTGRAYDWIWEFRQQNPYCQWDHLKYHFKKKFRSFESDFEIQRRIMERRQLQSESADSYISDIVKLKNQMRIQIPEHEIVRMIKDNLKDGLVQLVYPKEIETIDVLLEECRRAERNIAKRSSHRQQQQLQNYRRVNELEYNDPEVNEGNIEVEELKYNQFPNRPVVCWNCKKTGHTFMDCPLEQRNIFCFRCGFDGVTSPQCPKCLGNPTRNMVKPGPTCSQIETAQ